MPERHEHSYYEIALTGTQMVVAFVLVLACLLAAFFAGVYVGRDGSLPTVMAQADAGAEEPPAEEPPAGEAEGGAEPDAFDFFSEGEPEEAPPQPREIAEQADPSTTLLEDVGGEPRPRQEPQATPPPRDEVAGSAEAPARESEPPRRAAGEQQQSQPQGPVEQQETAPAAATAAEEAGGGLVIQVFSSDSYEQAQQVLERLRGGGMTAFLSPVEVNGRTMHRVRVGPYSGRARAEEIAQRVRQDYQLDTWITQGE